MSMSIEPGGKGGKRSLTADLNLVPCHLPVVRLNRQTTVGQGREAVAADPATGKLRPANIRSADISSTRPPLR